MASRLSYEAAIRVRAAISALITWSPHSFAMAQTRVVQQGPVWPVKQLNIAHNTEAEFCATQVFSRTSTGHYSNSLHDANTDDENNGEVEAEYAKIENEILKERVRT